MFQVGFSRGVKTITGGENQGKIGEKENKQCAWKWKGDHGMRTRSSLNRERGIL
jgi:hypothetical protein